jgi:16S rRNA (guanine(966)-N(2))-methyltransferase RsmD
MTLRIVAGQFKGRLLKTPKGSSTRPTQGMLREAVFNICQNEIEGARFLDLYAGSGAMGLEALSRGASHVIFVEQNRTAAACIQANIASLQLKAQTTVLSLDAARALAQLIKQGAKFDIVYVDPPYDIPFDPESVVPLLAYPSILFLEERAQPQKPLPKSPHLLLQSARRFGTALLSIFHYQENL